MINLKKSLHEIKRSKAPVRYTLIECQKLIQDSRSEGHSLSAIYMALKKNDVEAGKSYSSFNSAIKWLDKNGWPPEGDQTINSSSEPILSNNTMDSLNERTSKEIGGSPNAQGTLNSNRENFRDDRYNMDFGGSNHE